MVSPPLEVNPLIRLSDEFDEAFDELGTDYTEEEIRLVRIKFISEMAN